MKYCLFEGAIYKISFESEKVIFLEGIFGNETANKDEVQELSEEIYLLFKEEYEKTVKEIQNLSMRMYRLNDEYERKHTALQDMKTKAGRKEKEIIKEVIKRLERM